MLIADDFDDEPTNPYGQSTIHAPLSFAALPEAAADVLAALLVRNGARRITFYPDHTVIVAPAGCVPALIAVLSLALDILDPQTHN